MENCDFIPQIIDFVMGIFFPSETKVLENRVTLINDHLISLEGSGDAYDSAETKDT